MDSRAPWVYEAFMAVLALAVVWLLTRPDEGWVQDANLAIWMVFVADYVVRLYLSRDRRSFIRRNIPDLIAILPLDFLRLARLARLVRLIRLLRAAMVLWRVSRHLRGILATNGLGYTLIFSIILTIVSGIGIWVIDPTVGSASDGVWWSISTVTQTSVYAGDFSPHTTLGRVVSLLLLVVGIGTVGMITASLATYFLQELTHETNPHVEYIRNSLDEWDHMSSPERRQLAGMLMALADDQPVHMEVGDGAGEPSITLRDVPAEGAPS